MDNTEAIVQAAVTNAASGDDTGATGALDGGSETAAPASPASGEVQAGSEAVVSPSAGTTDPAAPTPAAYTPDEVDAILDKFGIRAGPNGERAGSINHGRVKKVVAKIREELLEANKAELGKLTDKLTPAEARSKEFDQLNWLADNHPEQFAVAVAKLSPGFQKYLESKVAAQAASAPAVTEANDPMPQPDGQYPDGTPGYTLKGMEARDAWLERRAVAKATVQMRAELEKQVGPIVKEREARKQQEAQIPIVQQKLATAKEVWGDLFDKHSDEILKALKDDKVTPFEHVVARVLVPKLKADRNTMREELRVEINARPAAAARSTPVAAVAAQNGNVARSTEDIVRDAVRSAAGSGV